eukprot:Nitzschia sp. Nitz4//scaffold60_size111251//100763//101782//NITZ4_004163-RA/size111251-processed-gene-0.19-mRNA-1//1//CDS//3329555612//1479//frame0
MSNISNPLVEQVDSFDEYSDVTKFLHPSEVSQEAPPSNGDATSSFVCEFQGQQPYAKHFPHAMQQLYACYSFFQQSRHDQEQAKADASLILLASSSVQSKIFGSNAFLKGYVKLLRTEMGVEVLANIPADRRIIRKVYARVPGGYALSYVPELQKLLHHTEEVGSPDQRKTCPLSPHIGVLNRRRAVGRSIENHEKFVASMRSELEGFSPGGSVELKYFEEGSFDDQVTWLSSVDILISPHGAQLTGLPFLAYRPCRQVFEIFPQDYFVPAFFGSLARRSELGYRNMYLADSTPPLFNETTSSSRAHARAANICLPLEAALTTVTHMLTDWKKCCDALS